MVVPNVDNILLHQFQGLDIERSAVTIEDNKLTRATNVVVRGGDLVKRPPFRLATSKEFRIIDVSSGNATFERAPTRALISPPGELVCVGPDPSTSPAHYFARSYSIRGSVTPTFDTGPTAGSAPAIAGLCETGADFVTVAKVGVDYYFGGPNGLWRLAGPAYTTWTKVTLPDATSGVNQVIYYKNRLWVVSNGYAGATLTEALRTRLYYSAPANPTSITSTINIAFNEGLGSLKAIIPFSDRIMCFTDRSVWNLFISGDTASWSQRLFLRGMGTVNPHSLLEHKGVVYFLNSRGLWKTDGNVLEEVSAPVRKWITSFGFYETLGVQSSIALYKDFLIVRIHQGADLAAYTMFLYNVEWDAWSGVEVNDSLTHHDLNYEYALNNYMASIVTSFGEEFVACGTNGGYICDFGDPPSGQDADIYYRDLQINSAFSNEYVNYDVEVRTKHFDLNRPPRIKDVLEAQVSMMGSESGAPSAQHTFNGWWYVDSDMLNPVFTTTYSGAETDIIEGYMYRFKGARYGRTFSFHFTENSQGYIKITDINLEAVLKRDSPENPSA